MNIDRSDVIIPIQELHYGKFLKEYGGAIEYEAPYEVLASSQSSDELASLLELSLFNQSPLNADSVVSSCAKQGALAIVATKAGVCAVRFRYQSEGGIESEQRKFLLWSAILIPGVCTWGALHPGFFSWCGKKLEVVEHLKSDPRHLSEKKILLPKWSKKGVDWFDSLDQWYLHQFGSSYQALLEYRPLSINKPPENIIEDYFGQNVCSYIDIVSTILPGDKPLISNGTEQILLTLGLTPGHSLGIISYSGTSYESIAAPANLTTLKEILSRGGPSEEPVLNVPPERMMPAENLERLQLAPGRRLTDDQGGRKIGKDNIELGDK